MTDQEMLEELIRNGTLRRVTGHHQGLNKRMDRADPDMFAATYAVDADGEPLYRVVQPTQGEQ